ncbi:eukaryotic translation elongation factor 1 epsilon-1 [Aricia agestis]|uniref:eukaryotic translation elongation factor 1 epsilon-1 n=1 Tax=Aricia agestis TaxID=91739 RepID=UPI001C207719|nr:eukaryotic translation elongation factor 1 epsilon-1 [Aricia agestis]
MDVIKQVGKYLNTPVGTLCYNTDKVLTTSLDKVNVEGFATIILRLAAKSNQSMNQEQVLLSYQWLEHISMYMNQAATNPAFAKNFLLGLNRTLEKNSYLTGSALTIADIAAYYVLHPIIERLSLSEQEQVINVCRWFKNVQARPKVCGSKKPVQLNTLTLSILAPAVH